MPNLLFVLESFRRHMDSGRYLFQQGMQRQGYVSTGHELPPPEINSTDVPYVLNYCNPRIVIFWPRYEWDSREWIGDEVRPEECFQRWQHLLDRPDILRVTVLHDAGSAIREQVGWHRDFQPHVYLIWYHAQSVAKYMPHVPAEKMLRTYHLVDADTVPSIQADRRLCILSGASNDAIYPLRTSFWRSCDGGRLPITVDAVGHPGYTQTGTKSPEYLRMLAGYRVAICSASVFGFALRKIFEATAAGCRVVTTLPEYDCLPGIDENLIRVPQTIDHLNLCDVIREAGETWDLERQRHFSREACRLYDWREETRRLAVELAARAETETETNTPKESQDAVL